jgi:pyruvate dehydrogenase E2 component (dihydrolipoamide acetyltransferase)
MSFELLPWPEVDFSAFGEVEIQPLSRIRQLTGAYLTRNAVMIPHVTHHDEADVGALEEYRAAFAAREGLREVSPLAFIVKAVVSGLRAFPVFNASLDASGKQLVLKKYFHVGIAVDTPQGLLVPVIRDCDRKSIADLNAEIAAIARKAREKGLSMAEMSGGCFTISSLGGIGGTAFTPLINAPEVAILGVTRIQTRAVPDPGGGIGWRPMLPLSLSYDHRVIDGAAAARFVCHLADALAKPADLG